MAKLLKLRRGSTSQHSSFTGAEGEVTVDTDKDTLVVHDGSTAGGHELLREDMSNLPAGTVDNADINASAAIAGTKISPNFGAQNIQTTGQLQLSGSAPTILLNDENNENDFEVSNLNGTFKVRDIDAGVDRLTINSSGTAGFSGNLDVGAGLDITGNITATGDVSATGNVIVTGETRANGNLAISNAEPKIFLTDTGQNPDYTVSNTNGTFKVTSSDGGGTDKIVVNTDGHIDITGNLDAGAGLDVTGNITVTGNVDGVDVAALNTTVGNLSLSGSTLSNGTTATTQSQGDNSTKVATTAYTDTAVANLVDSSPGALNTLNELAAAINDDASFSTTVNNNIATKLPLSGGTITGGLTLSQSVDDVLNFSASSTSDSRGIAFNGRTALSADHNDGYLRLNQLQEFGNGVYTPGLIRADAGFSTDGYTIVNASGQISAGRLTGALPALDGSNLTGIVSFVSGMIIMYNSATAPSGWYLCDGNNGTPDLRDRFIVGAGNSYSQGATGGSNTATDTVSISGSDTVNISISGTTSTQDANRTFGFPQSGSNTTPSHSHTFSGSGSDTVSISGSDTVSIDTRSPYYALTFIMKA